MLRQRARRDGGGGGPTAPRRARGQVFFEYAVLLGVVAAAMAGMYLYAKRGIQGTLKTAADQLSPFAGDTNGEKAQAEGMRFESGERTNQVVAAGTVLVKSSSIRTAVNQPVNTQRQAGGGVAVSYQNATTDNAGALENGGASHSEVVLDVR